jgi:hypothetical protein
MEKMREKEQLFREKTEALIAQLSQSRCATDDDELEELVLQNLIEFCDMFNSRRKMFKSIVNHPIPDVKEFVDNFRQHIREVFSEEYLQIFSFETWKCHYDILKRCRYVEEHKSFEFFMGDFHIPYSYIGDSFPRSHIFIERDRYLPYLHDDTVFNLPKDDEIRKVINDYINSSELLDFSFYFDMIEYYQTDRVSSNIEYYCNGWDLNSTVSNLKKGHRNYVIMGSLWKGIIKSEDKHEFSKYIRGIRENIFNALYSSIYMDRPFKEDDLPPFRCAKSARNR